MSLIGRRFLAKVLLYVGGVAFTGGVVGGVIGAASMCP